MTQRVTAWWQGRSRRARTALVAGIGALAVVAGAGAAMASGGQPARGAAATPPVLVSTVEASTTPTPTSTVTASPTPGTLTTLKALAEAYGDPPQANLGRFRIPTIGVDAPISQRAVGADLDLQYLNPYGPADVAWYDFAVDPRYGGAPGAGGNAVFAGHVDYADPIRQAPNAYYRGPGVFRNVDLLAPGDVIEIAMNGRTLSFTVVWKKKVPEHGDWAGIYRASVPEGDAITLISCAGNFDPVTREYDARTVIRAARS